jgi:monoamine oxidase
MVAFSGAHNADTLINCEADKTRLKIYLDQLQVPYPGIDRAVVAFEFANWLREEWSRGSYYFPRLGEIIKWGRFWKDGYSDWMHFAGEHTSYAFMGYMEGALSSGYRLARRLAERDHVLK